MDLHLQNRTKPNIKEPHCDQGEWSVESLVITFASVCMFREYLWTKNHCHSLTCKFLSEMGSFKSFAELLEIQM